MKKVLVTGAGGQLGRCIARIAKDVQEVEIYYRSSSELDIMNREALEELFKRHKFDFCVNCAAYTKVELAEEETSRAFQVNAEGVENLAVVCELSNTTLIHFSTDYVFDGTKNWPYREDDITNPLNVYGASKLQGERHIKKIMQRYFIIRTSWLYSDQGTNFFKTILEKASSGADLKVTIAERGTPTNAYDLARFVWHVIIGGSRAYGIYHFSNTGEATWYDFAQEIVRLSGQMEKISLEETSGFKTKAQRPGYSVLDKSKLLEEFKFDILPWQESLASLFRNKVT